MKSAGRDSVEPKLDFLGRSHGSTESRPAVLGGVESPRACAQAGQTHPNSGNLLKSNRQILEQEETEVTEFFIFRSLFPLCALLFEIASSCGDTVWRTRRRRSGSFCASSPLWPEDFTAKLFCNVECWLERLQKLVGLLRLHHPDSEFRP